MANSIFIPYRTDGKKDQEFDYDYGDLLLIMVFEKVRYLRPAGIKYPL